MGQHNNWPHHFVGREAQFAVVCSVRAWDLHDGRCDSRYAWGQRCSVLAGGGALGTRKYRANEEAVRLGHGEAPPCFCHQEFLQWIS